MNKRDKRVTRDMRLTMLKIHNDLKDIKNTIEECNDIWLSDLQKLNTDHHFPWTEHGLGVAEVDNYEFEFSLCRPICFRGCRCEDCEVVYGIQKGYGS